MEHGSARKAEFDKSGPFALQLTLRGPVDERILAEMIAEIGAASELYRPSNIWRELVEKHTALLRASGIENFKQLVNHDYAEEEVGSVRSRWFIALVKALGGDRPRFPFSVPRHALLRHGVFRDEEDAQVYGAFVCMLWDYAEQRLDGVALGMLQEPALGNPNYVTYRGKIISQDLARSLVEYAALKENFGATLARAGSVVAEIGAGYGRLAHVVCSLAPCRYIFIDIPPALCVAQWYIGKLFGAEAVLPFRHYGSGAELTAAMAGKRFIFLIANQVELLSRESVDLFVNIDSFGEMDVRSVRNYIAIMRETVRPGGGAYLRNLFPRHRSMLVERGKKEKKKWATPTAEDYRFGAGWTVTGSGPWPLDPDAYAETIWRKNF